MERITLAPGAHINVLPAEKFNRCRISINFIWPAAREWATAEALLPLVLERGYQGCPDMTELSKKLARLYGAALSVDGTMSGQSRVLTVSLSGIRDAFALAGEPLSREYADIAFGTAFEPYRVDGVLDAEAVAIEKEQLRELLEGEINEKRSYCIRQARRRFYGDSPAGIERNGYLDGRRGDKGLRAHGGAGADRGVCAGSGRGRGGAAPAHGAVGPAPRPGGAARAHRHARRRAAQL